MRRLLLAAWTVVAVALGCGPQTEPLPVDDGAADEAAQDATSELKLQLPGFTAWFKLAATKAVRDGRQVWVIAGRASKNLEGVHAFVFDDPLGNAVLLSARKFELQLDENSELNTMLSGSRVFLGMDPAGPEGQVTAALHLAPHFSASGGSSKLYVFADVTPIELEGALTYRAKVRATGATALTATPGAPRTSVRDGDVWNADFTFEGLRAGADAAAVRFSFQDGATERVKVATPSFLVSAEGLTREDAYEVWPPEQCVDAVQQCLDGLAPGNTDTSSCGSYRQVQKCNSPARLPQLGQAPDDLTALDAAVAAANAGLSAGQSVTAKDFYVQAFSARAPSLELVTRAYEFELRNEAPVRVGTLTRSALDDALDGYHAKAVVPAAQQVVFQQAFQTMALTSTRRSPRGPSVAVTSELLYFPSAGRLVVIELAQELRP